MQEMELCYRHLTTEINYFAPKIILLLGKQVASFVLKNKGVSKVDLDGKFNYRLIFIEGIYYLPVHHPSYVLIYKRKHVQNYIAKIKQVLSRHHYEEAIVQ